MSSDLLWERLTDELAWIIDEYRGVAGVRLVELNSGRRVDINGGVVLAAGSTIKVPVLMELCRKHDRGELDLDEPYTLTEDDMVGGSGVLQRLEGEVTLTLRNLAILMINVSDNIGTNICIDRAGMEDVNELLEGIGCHDTRLQRRMIDWEAVVAGHENISTARDMVRWLEVLYHGGWQSREVCDAVLSVLRKPKNTPIREALPMDVPLAGKTGGLEGVRCEVGLVELEQSPYILGVMTAFGMDGDNSAVITRLAGTVHGYLDTLDRFTEQGRGLPRRPR